MKMAGQKAYSSVGPWSAPLFRWAGSKRKQIPLLTLCARTKGFCRRYVEPFAGSACLFFALNPDAAILGDINQDLLHAYTVVRRHPRILARRLHGLPRDEQSYYKIRRQNPSELGELARALRFIYLNRYCFNGVYRTNKKGEFNVPRGIRTGDIPSERQFVRCSIALRRAELRAGDFENCLTELGKGDFVYLDPPYTSDHRPAYGEYGYAGCFGKPDHPRLLQALKRIDSAGADFLLSYSCTSEFISALPSRWRFRRIAVRRHVAGFATHRSSVHEILVSNRHERLRGVAP